MAKFILQDVTVSVNGVDLSDHAFSIDLQQTRNQVDVSGFNATGALTFLPGTTEETATIGFRQDFASSKVHSTISTLYQASSTFALVVKPTSSAISATNPAFYGTAAVFEYNGLSGNMGDASDISVVFKSADNTAPLKWYTA